jgi:hypothetical protein
VFSRLAFVSRKKKKDGLDCALPSVRDAYDGVYVPERSLEELVGQYAACVLEAEEAVVGKDGSDAQEVGMEYGLVCETGETGVGMDEGDAFAEEDGAQIGQEREEVGKGGGEGDGSERDVVYFERGEEIAYADAVWRMAVCDDDDLVESKGRKGSG